MKKMMLVAGWVVFAMGAEAQDITGTLLEQLAALQGYIITAEKGYRIAETGIHTIRDIRRGEFDLHAVFFGSLALVDPAVKDWPGMAETIQSAGVMMRDRSAVLARWRGSGLLSPGELDNAGGVLGRMAGMYMQEVQALETLLDNDALKMEDGERTRQIGMLMRAMRDQARGYGAFIRDVDLLILRRKSEIQSTGTLKKLYGLD